MSTIPRAVLLALTLPLVTAAAAQAPTPMTIEELRGCAQQIQHLRTESPRLLTRNAAQDERLTRILDERRSLEQRRSALGRDDLEAGLAIRARQAELNTEARALNAEVQQLRDDITAIGAVRDDYDRACSGRPMRRSDVEQLSAADQAALRSGLRDVQVPFLPPNLPPVPGFEDR